MGRNRKRKYPFSQLSEAEDANAIPIPNLPEKYLNIKLRNKRVKMKNLLTFAFDKCKNYDGVLWSAQGKDIEKLISLVEIFKRTNTEYSNQVNKLRFQKLKIIEENKDTRIINVPEMFIFLSKNTSEKNEEEQNMECLTSQDNSTITNETLESLAELKIKPGQKRPFLDNPLKKKKDKKKKKTKSG